MSVRCLSKASAFVNWRPQSHHILHEYDNLSDLRHYCIQKITCITQQIYYETINYFHSSLFRQLQQEHLHILQRLQPPNESVEIIFIISYLSHQDSQAMIMLYLQSIGSPSSYCISENRNCSSAHDILAEIAENMMFRLSFDKKSRVTLPSYLLENIDYCPENIIRILFLKYFKDSSHNVFYIIFQRGENISSEVLGDLLERISIITDVRFVLLFIHRSYQELPLYLQPNQQCLVHISIFETSKPWDLYDMFMGKLFTLDELPILPPTFIGHLHSTFNRAHKCLYSNLNILLHCYTRHFSHAMSLISFYRDKEFLTKVECFRIIATVFILFSFRSSKEGRKERVYHTTNAYRYSLST